jgi:sialate O-acetylesterase
MLTANDPQLRLFKAGLKASATPLKNVTGQWNETAPAPARDFSAVGYYFGKKLREELKVPIGLISTAWGGTQIESWISPDSIKADPDYEAIAAREVKDAAEHPNRQLNNMPSALYHGMNVPMAPLAIKGVAFYQGEANFGRGYQYRRLFPLMINDWRKLWGRPDLPFVWVQIPNIGPAPAQPTGSGWSETREAQTMTLSLPNTAMAVTIELGDANDVHPRYKREVGNRLALAALQKIYHRNIVGSGPLYSHMKIEGNAIRLFFNEIGGGLVGKEGGPLKGFAIAGADKKWVWADAKIDGDTMVVSIHEVSTPVAARYAWADTPVVTLYNKAGLPASPFRTDDWPEWTTSNK